MVIYPEGDLLESQGGIWAAVVLVGVYMENLFVGTGKGTYGVVLVTK